jgi:hypothetical protein
MMVAVIVIALVFGTLEELRRRRTLFHRRAAMFAQKVSEAIMREQSYRLNHRFASYDPRPSMAYNRLADHYQALRRKYERAAVRPWCFVGPDPPEPSWPKDVPRP